MKHCLEADIYIFFEMINKLHIVTTKMQNTIINQMTLLILQFINVKYILHMLSV